MTSLGYSSVPGANQILQPNIAGGANPSNSHFTDPRPQFSSEMGATAGCIGGGGSASALNANAGYNMERQTGGRSHVRGGYKKRHSKAKKSNKSNKSKKVKKTKSRKHAHRHRRGRRSMRGGLSSLSPSPFSGGANAPYHQFTGGEPVSFNYSVGGSAMPLPFNEIGTASNRMTNIHNNCGSNHGLIQSIK